mgnify:CR=1 FL=1
MTQQGFLRLVVELPPTLKEQWEQFCSARGQSIKTLTADALLEYMVRREDAERDKDPLRADL